MLKNYFRIAVRNLLKQKLFTSINIAGLTIGISVCLLIVLFICYEFSYETMFSQADRIYRVLTIDAALGTNKQRVGITMPALGPALTDSFSEIEAALRVTSGQRKLVQYGDKPGVYAQRIKAADENFFDFFDYKFREGDPQKSLAEPFTIVLTSGLAEQLFGQEEAMGATLSIASGYEVTVTGILEDIPANAHLQFDALEPLSTFANLARQNQPPDAAQPIWLEQWQLVAMPTFMMIYPGADIEGLDERITQLIQEHQVGQNFSITLQPLLDVHLQSTDMIFDPVPNKGDIKNIYIFGAIAVLILIIAGVNYMNLSTARSVYRAREVGMRKVVGSLSSQLRIQFLGESLLTALIAMLLAIPLLELTLPWLNEISGTSIRIGAQELKVILITLGSLWLLVGALAGLYPAFVLSGYDPLIVLKGSFKSSTRGTLMRIILVVLQFTMSVGLIGMTIIIQQQMHFIQSKDMGYNREQVIVFDMNDAVLTQGTENFRSSLADFSGFSEVATGSNIPGRTFSRIGVIPEGSSQDDIWIMSSLSISPEYLAALDMKMARGRNFSREIDSDNTRYVLINETTARQLNWEEPLGKRFFLGDGDSLGVEVAGVIRDFHFIGLHQNIEPVVMFPLIDNPGRIVIARIQPGQISTALEFAGNKWREIYPQHPFVYSFLDEEFDRIYRQDLNTGKVVNIFSVLAIFVACLGLFGLASHSISQRIKEIGVRKVMGASAWNIVRILVLDAVKWVILANLIAWPLAWYAARSWLQGFAYRIELNPAAFLTAALISVTIALLTVIFQTWRAAGTNPADALKYE